MPNTDPDVLVRRFVDGDLRDEEIQQALHRIADDADARAQLCFELEMTQELAAARSASPPGDFADGTMAALASDAASAPSSLGATLREWWAALTTPTLEVRPLSTAVAALLLGALGWVLGPRPGAPPSPAAVPTAAPTTSSASSPRPTVVSSRRQASTAASTQKQAVWIRFMYTNSTADSVAVAGDFSQWRPVSLSPRTVNGETVWTGLVPVSRGEHEYQFVIDGQRWVPDPLAPIKRSDGFGRKNAVLEI